MRSTPARRLLELSLLAVGLALFLGLAGYQLALPGPHYDEAIEVTPTMQLLLGQPVEAFRDAGIRIGKTVLPLMVMDYIGALNTYLALPFFAVLGINVIAMRVMPICFGAGALLFTYLIARELWGRIAGALALFLLTASVSFVFWSRQGIFVTNLTATLFMAMLWCALRWQRGKRPGFLYATAFLAGLGLYAKLIFVWAIVAVLGAALLVNLDRLRSLARQNWPGRRLAGAALAFLIPLTPLALFNVQTGGATLSTFRQNLSSSYYGVNNLDFISNLADRLEQFRIVLRGNHFWYLGETFANPLWLPALLAVLGLTIMAALARRRRIGHSWRAALFPFVMLALIIMQSCVTISALWFTHYAILTPLPPLALAGGLAFVAQGTRRTRLAWASALLIVAVVLAGDLQADVQYHRALAASGGYAAHSDAVYALADALDRAGAPAVALDWGIQAPVQLLTRGRVNPRELFGYGNLDAPDAEFAERLAPHLAQSTTLYVMHLPDAEVYHGRSEGFVASVAAAGKTSRVVGVIHERSGRSAFVLARVE